jgi:hypothetical protein
MAITNQVKTALMTFRLTVTTCQAQKGLVAKNEGFL